MKKQVVEEVHLFRVEIRAHARAAGRVCRRDGWTLFEFPSHAPGFDNTFCILHFPDPLPRGNSDSPMVGNHRATSDFTRQYHRRSHNLIMDDPSAELESSLTRMPMISFFQRSCGFFPGGYFRFVHCCFHHGCSQLPIFCMLGVQCVYRSPYIMTSPHHHPQLEAFSRSMKWCCIGSLGIENQ